MKSLLGIGTMLIAFLLTINAQSTPLAVRQVVKPKITFIELGSVNCIPCKQMQPVMKAVEKKYGDQVKVVFYDVWTRAQQQYARQYNIRLIPTQVFLDETGKEFFRHEGFFPEADIYKLFKQRGVTPIKADG